MLEAIRRRAASLVVKILFVILMLSFVVWGIGDVVMPGRSPDWVAEVGDATIAPEAFSRAYQQALGRLGESLGTPITPEQGRSLGLADSVLSQMIAGALLDRAGRDLGLRVGDDAVFAAITANPSFQNQDGAFDRDRFHRILDNNGLTEAAYVALLRSDIVREQIVGSVAAAPGVPREAVGLLHGFQNEKRVGRYLFIPLRSIAGIEAADEAALRAYYDEKPDAFTTPEYRVSTAIVLDGETLAETIEIGEAELRAAYEERVEEFTTPERRSFDQIVFSDRARAEEAAARLAAGESLAEIATKELGATAGDLRLTDVRRSDLPADLGEAVFALQPGGVGGPVASPLGWHLVELVGIEPGSRTPFETAAPALRRELARERATDAIIDLGNRLDDTLGRGATLEQAAAELGLPVRTVPPIDAAGAGPDGVPVAALPSNYADTAFATADGQQSLLTEAEGESRGDSYFVLRVDGVTPSARKPFEAVRDEIADILRERRRAEAAKARADRLADELRGGGPLDRVADAAGLKAEQTAALSRRDQASGPDGPPARFVAALFDAEAGGTFVVEAADGVYVGQVAEIRPADPGTDAAALAETREELQNALEQDLQQQYLAALRQRYPVRINAAALDRLF
jgi:peptidyl-prolyl cis-trans isomerase D